MRAPVPAQLTIAPDEVQVVRVDVRAHDVPALAALLDDAERARAARFAHRGLAEPWIVAHAALRDVLRRAGVDDPQFVVGAHGKPALIGGALDFNLSHSGALALIAIARVPIGVDVEQHGTRVHADVVERSFSPHERAALAQLARGDQLAGFFRCWSRKEAYLKARGLGLSLDLASFDVSVGGAAALLATRPDPVDAARWALHDLDVGAGYAAALVAPTGVRVAPLWAWPGPLARDA